MLIRKSYLEKVRPFVGLDVVKVITGMRRSGKSVLMEQIRDEIILKGDPRATVFYLNLEEEENAKFLKKGVLHEQVLKVIRKAKGKRVAVFLDEIHEVEDWEITVNSLRAKKNVDVYVTGSNSKLLSGELATYLTGRYVEIKVSPYSFAEFREASSATFGTLSREELFRRYLEFGGMPFLANLGYRAEWTKVYLEDVFSSILLKDVARRGKIRDIDLLNRVVRYVMTEAGHTFSAASIVRYFKHEGRPCTVDTVLNYLTLCEEAFLFTRVPREDLIGRKVLAVDEKFYVTDHGMRRAMVGGSVQQDIDQMLENLVCGELLRRGWKVSVGRVQAKEIDFVAERGDDKRYYQVAYLMPDEKVRKREFGAFEGLKDGFSRFVVSMDPVDMSNNGVRHMNICDFLLQSE